MPQRKKIQAEVAPEVVEVPVQKVEVKVTLEDILNGLAKESQTLAATKGTKAPPKEVAERLKRVNQMTQQVLTELKDVKARDEQLFRRLERGSAAVTPPTRARRTANPPR
jgi:hypothetical protein